MENKEIAQTKTAAVKTTANTDNILEEFLAETDIRSTSRDVYRRQLRQFFNWVEETGRALDTLTSADLIAYKECLLTERCLTPLTVSGYITALKSFYRWAEGKKYYPNISAPVKQPKRKQSFKRQHLTEEQSHELLAHYEAISLRDFAIVNLILRTGLRTIEVARANVEDITFKGGKRILVVWGKGRDSKEDFVILTDKAYIPIKNYLATRKGAKAAEPLFISTSNRNENGRLTTRTISGICKDGLRAIGLDDRAFCAHSLRHTTACQLLEHGASIAEVQGVLRHSSPATTQIYVESVKEDMRLKNSAESRLDDVF